MGWDREGWRRYHKGAVEHLTRALKESEDIAREKEREGSSGARTNIQGSRVRGCPESDWYMGHPRKARLERWGDSKEEDGSNC